MNSHTGPLTAALFLFAFGEPMQAQNAALHAKFVACDNCVCGESESVRISLPAGRVFLKLRTVNWSATRYTGIPSWLEYQALRGNQSWSGWAESLQVVSENRIKGVRSRRTPERPSNGAEVLFEDEYAVGSPTDIQVKILSQRWRDGSGACHQTNSENWLTIDTDTANTSPTPTQSGTVAPSQAASTIAGSWNWVSGQTLVVHADGAVEVYQGNTKINDGRWEILDGNRYRITHRNGGWVDTVILSADGRSLEGTNNRGDRLQGTRGTSSRKPPQVTAGTIAGTWNWVAGQTLVVHPGGTFDVYQDNSKINDGRWELLDGSRYRFTHRNGGWVDTVVLASDGRTLDGTNNLGARLQGTRRTDGLKPPPVAAATIAGTWNWVAGQTLVVQADGAVEVYQGNTKINDGRWELLDGSRYRITHRNGGWVDTVVLSADGRRLDGTNNRGDRIQGTRR